MSNNENQKASNADENVADTLRYIYLTLAWLLAIGSFFYFVPFAIALTRRKNPIGVLIVNALLGWTGIGWIVAVVMACGEKTSPQTIQVINVSSKE